MKIAEEYFQALLASDDPCSALHTLDALWCARSHGSTKPNSVGLSDPELHVHRYLVYQAEVGNGGHIQFFTNPSGNHAAETLTALDQLGLRAARDILSKACSVFPNGLVPDDIAERSQLVEGFRSPELRLWDSLDTKLDASATDLWSVVLRYVKEHQIARACPGKGPDALKDPAP